LLPLGVGLYALLQIRRLCSALSSASVFGEQLTGALRRLALALLGLAICEVFVHTAHSVVLTYFNAPGQRMLLIGISSDTMLHVVVALLILALAAVLREASNIVAEHRQFV
jgi:Protein of unknown function (DUF2975)